MQSCSNMGKDIKERACIWEIGYFVFLYLYIQALAEALIQSDLNRCNTRIWLP